MYITSGLKTQGPKSTSLVFHLTLVRRVRLASGDIFFSLFGKFSKASFKRPLSQVLKGFFAVRLGRNIGRLLKFTAERKLALVSRRKLKIFFWLKSGQKNF